MTPTVHLHIGEPKTGTTYIQAMLSHHREQLGDVGVMVPGRNLDHIRAGHDVLGRARTAGTHSTEGAWQALADQIVAAEVSHAVISMEMLTRAGPRQAARAVEAFGNRADVRVLITTRELSRLVPARWQESVQFRKSWSLDEYASGVFSPARQRDPGPGRHFWGLHDTPVTIGVWGECVGREKVTVVTLPPSGSPPDLLWRRFGQALGVDLSGFAEATVSNPSLGAASAELMRRLNEELSSSDLGEADHARICRKFLGKTVLPALKDDEPGIALPVKFLEPSSAVSEQLVAEIGESGAAVVGDLSDLLPAAGGGTPDEPTEQQVMRAALRALGALVEQNATLARAARRRGSDLPFAEVEE